MVADRTARTAPFTDEDLNLLLALAGQATVAVENHAPARGDQARERACSRSTTA